MASVIDDLIRASTAKKNRSSPSSSWADEEEKDEFTMDSLHPSIPRPNDEWDHLGRNVTAIERHQNLIPWTLVKYNRHGRLCKTFGGAW